MGKVIAVCTSEKKGTQKTSVPEIDVREDWGIQGDAHAGKWHRQVSLLSYEKIEAFRARGAEIEDGAFGENIIVQGIDFATLPVGTKFACNDVVLELTQIGKECHSGCAIFKKMGECIMPKQGVFTKGPVRIKKGAWLGFRCNILSGVTVGEHSVIAAGAIVTKNVPPYSVVAGCPARVIKKYDFDKQEWIKV